jgi:hypothetical protein
VVDVAGERGSDRDLSAVNYEGDRMSGRKMGGAAIHLHVIEVGLIWGLIIDRHLPQLQCMVMVNPSCAQPHVVSR